MQYQIEFKIRVDKNLKEELIKKLKLKDKDLISYKVLRESIDARDKSNVLYNYLLEINVTRKINYKGIKELKKIEKLELKSWNYTDRPVIVGLGPAGLFAGLCLARMNARPIIIERGEEVNKRQAKVKEFWENKILDLNSNVVFGEGGAGTFSDGKLQTNLNSPYIRFILEEFVKHGANSDILTSNYPHIGTDVLAKVIPNIRQEIIALGGEIYFNCQFLDYIDEKDELIIKTNLKDFKTKHLILAIGHSAKDTFKMLYQKGIAMEPKNFAVGVRIEHDQEKLNMAQYGDFYKYLPPANYKLAVHLEDRSVFTFCMCPGGYVVPSQNETNSIITNGMSNNKREGKNANSALLVEVKVSDFYKGNPLDGFDFITDIERKAYNISKDYRAPSNLVREFLDNRVATETRSVKTTYFHDINFCDLGLVLPSFVVKSLRKALPLLEHKLKGIAFEDNILIGVETRSSCPLQIKRQNYKSSNPLIYPVGEGSGFAGGITSSALDGIKCVISMMEGNNEN